jgi:Resolvase, N terminal domain
MIETSPQNRHLGYARVSTYGQTLDAQLQQFRAEGCAKVYREKASGAQTNPARLRRVIGQVEKGDVLTVTRALPFNSPAHSLKKSRSIEKTDFSTVSLSFARPWPYAVVAGYTGVRTAEPTSQGFNGWA